MRRSDELDALNTLSNVMDGIVNKTATLDDLFEVVDLIDYVDEHGHEKSGANWKYWYNRYQRGEIDLT